jgi:peptide subunit release factor 1 (eRF1)
MMPYTDGKQLIIGGPGMTKDKFVGEFPISIKNKVLRVTSVGYTDENGLWELAGKSRYEVK